MIFFSRRVFSLPLEINLEIRILSQLKLKSASYRELCGARFYFGQRDNWNQEATQNL